MLNVTYLTLYMQIDDGWESFMSLLGRKAKEETDAHIWFMERVQRYKRWMKKKLDEVSDAKI